MTYQQLRTQLKTGDIILFSGKSPFSSIIKFFSRNKWSHVGMVVRLKEIDLVLLWESNTSQNIKDAIDNKLKVGVQTVFLSDKINLYEGEIAVRQLVGEVNYSSFLKLKELRSKLKNIPYEKDISELANAVLDAGNENKTREDFSSVFCSELVAEALQTMDILKTDLAANEYTPADFDSGNSIDKNLCDKYRYGPLIKIK